MPTPQLILSAGNFAFAELHPNALWMKLADRTLGDSLEAKARCVTHAPHTIRQRRRKSNASTLSLRLLFPNIIFHLNAQSF